AAGRAGGPGGADTTGAGGSTLNGSAPIWPRVARSGISEAAAGCGAPADCTGAAGGFAADATLAGACCASLPPNAAQAAAPASAVNNRASRVLRCMALLPDAFVGFALSVVLFYSYPGGGPDAPGYGAPGSGPVAPCGTGSDAPGAPGWYTNFQSEYFAAPSNAASARRKPAAFTG